jgi:hypothetical protein
VRAIQITEKNLTDVVAFINRNGGAATGHNGDTRSKRPARIRIKQLNFGENWGKRDWRVAKLGDYIVRREHDEFGTQFFRVKELQFEEDFELIK